MGIDGCIAGQATDLDAFLAKTRASTEIDALRPQVREATLAASLGIREPQFTRITAGDLAVVFERYDALFFGASIPVALGDRVLTFRLSTRVPRRGGSLRVFWPRDAADGARQPERYELSVSTTLLFESFHDQERPITIGGQECADRLDALQRIMEHEMVHLLRALDAERGRQVEAGRSARSTVRRSRRSTSPRKSSGLRVYSGNPSAIAVAAISRSMALRPLVFRPLAATAAYSRPKARAAFASNGSGAKVASARCSRSCRRPRSSRSVVA